MCWAMLVREPLPLGMQTVNMKSIAVTLDLFQRTGPFAVDQISSQGNKEDKIGTRRATHNEVERRRRDNINNWIMKLSKLLPDCGNSGDSGGAGSQGKQSQSKGGILAKACEYLADMRNITQRLADSLKRTEEANQENERLSSQIEQLQVRREEKMDPSISLLNNWLLRTFSLFSCI